MSNLTASSPTTILPKAVRLFAIAVFGFNAVLTACTHRPLLAGFWLLMAAATFVGQLAQQQPTRWSLKLLTVACVVLTLGAFAAHWQADYLLSQAR